VLGGGGAWHPVWQASGCKVAALTRGRPPHFHGTRLREHLACPNAPLPPRPWLPTFPPRAPSRGARPSLPKRPSRTCALSNLACARRKGVWMNSECVTGPMSISSQILSMYSGRMLSSISVSVQPWEWPTAASEDWPVKFSMKSIWAGRSSSASSSMELSWAGQGWWVGWAGAWVHGWALGGVYERAFGHAGLPLGLMACTRGAATSNSSQSQGGGGPPPPPPPLPPPPPPAAVRSGTRRAAHPVALLR
jgi:hypothetical protein